MAIIDQLRVSSGLTPLDGPSQTLPMLYAMNAGDFHDITSGYNGVNQSGYNAQAGYDMVTGIGSPIANKLAPDFFPVTSRGTIAFSADGYNIGSTATILVKDLDLKANSSCMVTVTSSARRQRECHAFLLGRRRLFRNDRYCGRWYDARRWSPANGRRRNDHCDLQRCQ